MNAFDSMMEPRSLDKFIAAFIHGQEDSSGDETDSQREDESASSRSDESARNDEMESESDTSEIDDE